MSSAAEKIRRTSRLRPGHVRAMAWANAVLTTVRADLKRDGTRATVRPPPAHLPTAALADVTTVLRVRRATCLERSLVLQRWLADHGRPFPVAIGVSTVDDEFKAHAWLPGFDLKRASAGFTEIRRIEP